MKIFLIISGSFLFLSGLFAQNIEETYLFGNKQAELENYDLAIESYRRVLFFDSNYYSLDVSQKLAFCYLQMGQPDKSLQFLDLASNLTSNDSLENEIFFRKVSIYLQSFNYDYALLELESLNNIPTAYFFQKKEFYYGIIYFQKEDYQKSQNHILNSIDSSYTAQRADINNLFNKIDKLKRYNPNTARILSLIIPGMGQLYAGDIKNSLNSFILTGSFAVLFVYTAKTYSFLDAIMSVMPWYERYFIGGYTSAGKITKDKREEKRNELYQKLITLIASTKK